MSDTGIVGAAGRIIGPHPEVANVCSGIYGPPADPTGAKVSTAAIRRVIAAAQSAIGGGVVGIPVYLGPGQFVIDDTITDGAAPVTLITAGPNRTYIRWAGPAGGWMFEWLNERCQWFGGATLQAHTAALQGQFKGVHCLASRGYFQELYMIYPDTGVEVDAKYGNIFEALDIYQAYVRGLSLVNQANSNMFRCKQVTGFNYNPGSHGIHVHGMANQFDGNQLSQFDRGIYQADGQENELRGFFTEDNTYNGELAAGHLRVRTTSYSKRWIVAAGAYLERRGAGPSPGSAMETAVKVPLDCAAYYPMQEGTGVTLYDRSGNRQNAAIIGGTSSWGAGGFGQELTVPSTGIIDIPGAAVDLTKSWTFLARLHVSSWYASGNQSLLLSVRDGVPNSLNFTLFQGTTNIEVRANGVFKGNLSMPLYDTDDVIYVVVSYNPTTQTVTVRHPAQLGAIGLPGRTLAVAPPWTGAAAHLYVHSTSVAGTAVYSQLALWQRELSDVEVLLWIEQQSQPVAIAALPRTYSPTLTPVAVPAASVGRQTFTVNGLQVTDRISVQPPASAVGVALTAFRVSAANQLELTFINPTAGALTPTAGVYEITATRS